MMMILVILLDAAEEDDVIVNSSGEESDHVSQGSEGSDSEAENYYFGEAVAEESSSDSEMNVPLSTLASLPSLLWKMMIEAMKTEYSLIIYKYIKVPSMFDSLIEISLVFNKCVIIITKYKNAIKNTAND